MRITVTWLQEVEFLAGFDFIALPAAVDALLLATLPYLAERRSATAFASVLAAESYQCSQYLVALLVILEYREICRHRLGYLGEVRLS